MTIKELIRKLETLDGNMDVYCGGNPIFSLHAPSCTGCLTINNSFGPDDHVRGHVHGVLSPSDAVAMADAGEFDDWASDNYPITVNNVSYWEWESDEMWCEICAMADIS